MKVRIIKKAQYVTLHHVQMKLAWFPFWVTVDTGSLKECELIAENLLKHGETHTVIFEGESK